MTPPLLRRLLDFLYPSYCQLCDTALTHGRCLCDHCQSHLPRVEAPYCNRCGECYDGVLKNDFICPNCSTMSLSFEFARAALHSEAGARQLVHDFKYLRQIHLAPTLGHLLVPALEDPRFEPYRHGSLLVPVPLFWKRLRQRQFNQAEQLAIQLSLRSGIPWTNALKRTRNTQTQTRYSRAKRLKNLTNAFTCHPSRQSLIQNRSVILIDDVFTTGSTANACAKALLEAGADKVAVLTVLRG